MALGRLQLGEFEHTGYTTRDGKDVSISFRHPTKGEVHRSFAKQGITVGEDGSAKSEDGNAFSFMARLEDADVELAKLCITESSIGLAEIEREILVQIGAYLRDATNPSEDEGKG